MVALFFRPQAMGGVGTVLIVAPARAGGVRSSASGSSA
jgi:hypothetical protein